MNRVILIGNLCRDPELHETQSGVSLCTFTLAVQRRYADADGQRRADFINVVAWRQLAENCGRYLAKGRKAAVEGSIQTRSYDAQDGTRRYATEVVADGVDFLSPAQAAAATPPRQQRMQDLEGFTQVDDEDMPF